MAKNSMASSSLASGDLLLRSHTSLDQTPVRAGVMMSVLLGFFSQLLQFEAHPGVLVYILVNVRVLDHCVDKLRLEDSHALRVCSDGRNCMVVR